MSHARGRNSGAGQIPLAERILGVVSAAIVLALAGFLVVKALGNNGGAPEVSVEVVRISEAGGGWLVELEATNNGEAPASDVEIEGRLEGPEGAESGSIAFDQLPSRSSRRGGIWFTENPRTRRLSLRAVGYRVP